MNGRTILGLAIVVASTVVIAAVTARDAPPSVAPLAELPKGVVYIVSDGNQVSEGGENSTLENLELRTHGDVTFVVGREVKADPQSNKFAGARVWIRLSSIKMMVEVPK